MKLTNFLVIALLLASRTCRLEIVVATSNPDESTTNLIKDLMTILTSCLGDRLQTVGLAGSLPDALARTLSMEHSIPIVLLDDVRNYTIHPFFVPVQYRHKIDVFIIEASTSQQLDVIIEMNIKSSIWWNNLASFLIVDRSSGCLNAEKFLWTAWYRDALHAKVLCYGNETAKTIYNYNPYTRQAPVPWQHYTVRQSINGHPFNVFYRKYRADESICLNLDFEKTKDLGGYEIPGEGPKQLFATMPKTTKNVIAIKNILQRVENVITRSLNATMKIANKHPFEPLSTNSDIKFFFDLFVRFSPRQLASSPVKTIGYILISKFRGNKSQVDKIFSLIDMDSWIALGIVCLITLLFFKFFIHKAIIPAVLNTIRIICNTGFTNLTNDIASRIYIGCLLLFTIIMQVAIQCDLATLLTTSIPLKNINTMEDIETYGYKICITNFTYSFSGQEFRDPVVTVSVEECFNYVMNEPSYVYYELGCCEALDAMQKYNLYMSPEFIRTFYSGFEIRWNWALENPINRIIATLVETDTLLPWEFIFSQTQIDYFMSDKTSEKNVNYKSLELGEVAFVFVILGIGLTGAAVSFIFELVIRYTYIYIQENQRVGK